MRIAALTPITSVCATAELGTVTSHSKAAKARPRPAAVRGAPDLVIRHTRSASRLRRARSWRRRALARRCRKPAAAPNGECSSRRRSPPRRAESETDQPAKLVELEPRAGRVVEPAPQAGVEQPHAFVVLAGEPGALKGRQGGQQVARLGLVARQRSAEAGIGDARSAHRSPPPDLVLGVCGPRNRTRHASKDQEKVRKCGSDAHHSPHMPQ